MLNKYYKHSGSQCYAELLIDNVPEFNQAYKTKQTPMVLLKFHGGDNNIITMHKEDFLFDYKLYEPSEEELMKEACVAILSNSQRNKDD